MKKTNFFKLLMVGATALALGFTSCQKGPSQGEFDDLCKRVSTLETDYATLKGQLEGLEYVKSVVKTTDNAEKVEWTVTHGGKSTGGTVVITVPKGDGSGGGPTPDYLWVKDGNWYIGDTNTDQKAISVVPEIRVDAADDKPYWYFPVIGADKKITWVKGANAIAASYAVELPDGAGWQLYLPDKTGKTLKGPIKIAGADSGIYKIDILGWIQGKGAASEDISRFQSSDAYLNYEAYMEALAKDEDVWTDADGTQQPITKVPEKVAGLNPIGAAFPVPYAYIAQFNIEDDETADTGDFVKASPDKWDGGSEQYVPKQVLTTLKAESMGWLVNVHPVTANISQLEGLILQNAKDGVPPITIGKPELITGVLTRAASESALYFLPFDSYIHDKDGNDVTYTNEAAYLAKYYADALYSVVTPSGFRSEYSLFTIAPEPVTSFEAAVDAVNGPAGAVIYDDLQVITVTQGGRQFTGAHEVYVKTPYTIDFDVTAAIPNADDETDSVIDYYLTMSPEWDNNGYIKAQFGITFSEDGKTFTVGKHPDVLTLTGFVLRAYKLGIDGKIYIEDVNIYPLRTQYGATIYDDTYLVTDDNNRGNTVLTTPFSDETTVYSAPAEAPLTAMFAKLATVDATINDGKTTLEARWKHNLHGAKDWNIVSLTIDGKKVDGTEYKDLVADDTGATKPTLEQWLTAFVGAGGKMGFFPAGTTVPAADNIAWNSMNGQSDLYDARRLIIQPPYARTGGTLPFFDINKEYVMRFEFYDDANLFLSYADIKFTPVLPSLAELFKRENEYWTGNTLNAYYRSPFTHWPATDEGKYTTPQWFYDVANNGAADSAPWATAPRKGSTFYNVYVAQGQNRNHTPNTPYDSGYLKFGNSEATDTKWLDASSHIDFRPYGTPAPTANSAGAYMDHAKVGAQLAADAFNAAYNTGTVVEFYNQTPVEDNDADWYAKPIPMTIIPGKYIAVYDYTEYEDADGNQYEQAIAKELADLNFDLKIMSALEQGTIAPKGSDKISYIGGGKLFLNEDSFDAWNYSKAVKYSLFSDANGKFDYNYVYKVEFFMPLGAAYADYGFNSDYEFINAAGESTNAATAVQINPPTAGDANGQKKPYIGLQISNTTNGKTTYVGVKVTDRYGKVKEELIPIAVQIQ